MSQSFYKCKVIEIIFIIPLGTFSIVGHPTLPPARGVPVYQADLVEVDCLARTTDLAYKKLRIFKKSDNSNLLKKISSLVSYCSILFDIEVSINC